MAIFPVLIVPDKTRVGKIGPVARFLEVFHGHGVAKVDAHQVHQPERPHGMSGTVDTGVIDIFKGGDA